MIFCHKNTIFQRERQSTKLQYMPITHFRYHHEAMLIRKYLLLVLSIVALLFGPTFGDGTDNSEQTCGWDDRHSCGGVYRDANLKEMHVNLPGRETETFLAYVHPDISTFYNKTEGSMKITETRFTGLMGKFVNLAPHPITIFWKPSARLS